MATDAVPSRASSDSIIEATWFRFVVRTALALLAFWALWFAADRFRAFRLDGAANFRLDGSLWLAWAGATVAAGLLFGLATWLPFAKIRFLPSRLLLAAVALLPLAHFSWLYIESHAPPGGWLVRFSWFDDWGTQFVMAAFAGVAIASGFQAKRSRPAPVASARVHSPTLAKTSELSRGIRVTVRVTVDSSLILSGPGLFGVSAPTCGNGRTGTGQDD